MLFPLFAIIIIQQNSIVNIKLSSTIYDCVGKLQQHKIGHIVIAEKDIHSIVGILSKKDFLLFMVRNFTSDEISGK